MRFVDAKSAIVRTETRPAPTSAVELAAQLAALLPPPAPLLSLCRLKNKTTRNLFTKYIFAASAAVHYETSNFHLEDSAQARPDWGVPKAFFQGHASACSGT